MMNIFSPQEGSAETPRPTKIQEIHLPEQIVTALGGIIQRTRRLVIIRGVCASCAAGIGAFLLIMLLDASVTLLEPWPRWLMTILAYAVWAAATIWFLIRPLTHSFTLAGVARLIETHHPELQERISSAVELLNSRDLPSIRGSETLIAALTAEAVRGAITLQPRREISFRSAIPFVVATAVVLIALAALCLVQPRQAGFLLARATAPFLNLPNVQAIDLIVEPGDTLVAAGSSLQVSLRTANPAVTSAQLRQMNRQGQETVTAMILLPALTNQPGRRFAVSIPAVTSEFQYRVHAGDALSKYFTVHVAIPPVIEHMDITYRYPAYTRLEEKHERDWSGTIRAIAGTDVSLSAQVNKPVSQASLFINTSVITNTFKGTLRMEGKTVFYDFKLSLPKGLKGDWTLRLSDEINLLNKPFEHLIQAIPDTRPVVTVTSPTLKELRLNRDTRLPVTYHAEDDYGLTAAALVLTFTGLTNDLIRPLPLPATQSEFAPRLITSEIPIVLADPVFTNAPRVSVRIRAYDTLPGPAGGPQFSDSEPFTILFDKQADSWIEQVLNSQDQRVQKGLKQVQQKLVAAREQNLALEKNLSQKPIPESAARQIDTLQDTLASADNELRKLATDIDKGFYETLSSNLTALAENHVSKAENQAGQLRLVDTPAERSAITSNITAEIATSLETVENAMKEHAIAQAAVHRAVELEQLADKQAALARARQEMEQAPSIPVSNATALAQTAAASNEWSRAQDQVADELAKVARETPGSVAQAANTLSNLTTQAAAQATELADHQNELAKLTQAESDRLQKLNSQWHELATRQNQLAELARAEPLAAGQNESMRNAAKDLDAGKQEQALKTQADVSEALRQAAGQKASQLAKQASELAREAQAEAREAGRKAAGQNPAESKGAQAAQAAAQAAEKAAQQAEKASQQAGEAAAQVAAGNPEASQQQAQAAEEQAKGASGQAEQAKTQAEAAAAQAKQEGGSKAEAGAKMAGDAAAKAEKAAGMAAEAAQMAEQAAGQQAGQQGEKQAGQQGDQQGEKQAGQQGGQQGEKQAGQQGGQQGEKQAGQQGGQQGEKQAGQQGEKQAGQQGGKQGEKQAGQQGGKQGEKQAGQQGGQQGEKQAGQQGGKQGEKQAGQQGGQQGEKQAGQQGGQQGEKQAGQQGGQQRGQRAGGMGSAEKKAIAAQQAARTRNQSEALKLAELTRQQEELHREGARLMTETQGAKDTLQALQLQQEQVSGEANDLTMAAQVLHAQADDFLPQSQVATKTAQAAQDLAQASQSANQSAQQMQKATGEADKSGRTPSAQEQQQAASQALQSQRSAAQSLKQAASQLQQGATATAAAQPAPAASGQPSSASPAAQQALAQASLSTRQAAENAQAAAASQAASQLAQAAQAAAIDAQSKGANPSPSALQSASSGSSGDGSDKPQATDGAPSFARRMGMKLQDWLKLHGELKDDVLQSANNEGPEEYRPIIQKYFHEVSGHGEED